MIGKSYFYFCCIFISSICADISVKIELDNTQVFYGESIQMQVSIDGGDESAAVDMTSLANNFDVKYVGNQSKNISSVRIINGQMTKDEFKGHLFVYNLTPKAAGNYAVGPITITHQNKNYQSNKLQVNITGPEKGEYVFMKIKTPKQQYVLGEKFSVSLEIYIKKLTGALSEHDPLFPQDPVSVTIPWLQGENNGLIIEKWSSLLQQYLISSSKPGFSINDISAQDDSIFSIFENTRAKFMFPREIVEEVSPTGEKNNYVKYTLKHDVEAEREGTYTFGPVLLKGIIASRALSDGRAEAKKVVVVGEPCKIKIASVPTEGRPMYYSGAIGSNFKITTALLTKSAYVGDLLDLVVTIEGNGQVANVIPLKISEQKQIADFFKVYDDNVNVDVKTKSKKFQYSLRPNAVVKAFPPVYFSYFDTQAMKYITIQSNEIPLEIKEAQSIPQNEILTTIKDHKENLLIKINEGIYANYEKEDALQSQQTDYTSLYVALLITMPLLYFILLVALLYQNKWGNNIAFQRKRKALKKAKDAWGNASKLDIQQQYIEAANILRGYIADHFNLNEQALVSGEILGILKTKVSQDSIASLQNFFELCESIQYGADANPDNLQDLNTILDSLAKQL